MKTGLLFGSFNPIHIGHLIIAQYFLDHSNLEEIWFVISPLNPLKKETDLIEVSQRTLLVNKAITGNPYFSICDIEFTLPRPSYTYKTLQALKELHSDRQFVIIMGSDSLNSIEKWKNYEEILRQNTIYIYPRKDDLYAPFKPTTRQDIRFFDAPFIGISSTMIRDLIEKGKSVRYLVPQDCFELTQELFKKPTH